ncbi:MAG: sigma-70 family RNA polymerase sigma factor [Armatimonadota bacterium]
MFDVDTELMIKTANDDESAFKELFERNYNRAVNIAYRVIGDKDIAEDISLESFCNIYNNRKKYSPKAKFTTYLFRIVTNLSINKSKSKKETACVISEFLIPISSVKESTPEENIAQSELEEKVKSAILKLPYRQRLALIFTQYEKISYSETAEILKVSVKAVESLVHRAKESLRKELSEYIKK